MRITHACSVLAAASTCARRRGLVVTLGEFAQRAEAIAVKLFAAVLAFEDSTVMSSPEAANRIDAQKGIARQSLGTFGGLEQTGPVTRPAQGEEQTDRGMEVRWEFGPGKAGTISVLGSTAMQKVHDGG